MSKTLTATFAAQCENEKYPVRLVEDCSGTPINQLFRTSKFTEALFHPTSGSVFSDLKVPQIGDVAQYLVKHKIVESTVQQDKIPSSLEWIRDSTSGQVISTKGSAVCLTSALDVWIQLDPSLADGVVDSIQRHVNNSEFAKSITIQPFVGCFCLALFSDDQQWYRAQVEAIHPDSVVVKYVDYGNSSSVGLDHLRALPGSLTAQPALALRCALDGATGSGSSLPNCQECQAAIFSRILSVTLVGKTDDYIIVRLLDENGQDLNQKLGLIVGRSRNVVVEVFPNSEQVRVSHVKSASMFWIQRKSDDEVIEQIRDNLRKLDGQSSDGRIDLVVGELYAVMHPEYNELYRVRVERINGEYIEAFFLDYGFTLSVCTANVRPCPALLKYIPPMAAECTFRQPIHTDQLSEEMQKAFTEATKGVMCQAVFSGPQPAKGVRTVEAIYAKGVEVATLLSKLRSSTPVNNNRYFAGGSCSEVNIYNRPSRDVVKTEKRKLDAGMVYYSRKVLKLDSAINSFPEGDCDQGEPSREESNVEDPNGPDQTVNTVMSSPIPTPVSSSSTSTDPNGPDQPSGRTLWLSQRSAMIEQLNGKHYFIAIVERVELETLRLTLRLRMPQLVDCDGKLLSCYLHGIAPVRSSRWPDSIVELVRATIVGKTFRITIMKMNGDLEVNLKQFDKPYGQVADQLEARGLAIFTENRRTRKERRQERRLFLGRL